MEKRDLTMEALQADTEENLQKDGHITPVLFICTGEESYLIDVTEAVKDIDQMIQWTVKTAKEKKAYKVFFVSEIWKHEVDAEDTEKIVNSTEAYQIIEIQQDRINLFIRDFVKDKDMVLFTKGGGTLLSPEKNAFSQIQGALNSIQ